MNSIARILIVDDDPQIRELLSDYLTQHGYHINVAGDGIQMRRELNKMTPDLIVLDIMLPGEDGFNLCRELRLNTAVPIIMLSAAGEETDRVVGLEMGADDYLSKPFSPRELLARIKALLRRAVGNWAANRKASHIISLPHLYFTGWILDRNKQQLTAKNDGMVIPLSRGEYELLLAFIEHPRRVLSRDQLLDLTRNREAEPFDRTIDVQVGRLRKKIEKDPKAPEIIVTVRGGGYQFNADVCEQQPEV